MERESRPGSFATIAIMVFLVSAIASSAAAVDTPIEVSPLLLDFGDVEVGMTSGQLSVQVTNTGSSSFGPINMFGGAPPSDEFNASQNCQGKTLAAGASCQVNYSFSPGAPGQFSDSSNFTISPTSSQADGENFSVSLTGHGGPSSTDPVVHARAMTLGLRKHLVAKGTLSVADGFADCVSGVTVRVQRRRAGAWRTIDTDVVNAEGAYRELLPDRVGKYRTVVKRRVLNAGEDVCPRTVSPVRRHKHG